MKIIFNKLIKLFFNYVKFNEQKNNKLRILINGSR